MNVTFYGATREVTGSMHLISTGRDKILLDCGLFQGRRKDTRAKNSSFAFDPRMLSNGILSHAHADQNELLTFLKQSNLDIKKIAVVHGEEEQSLALADKLSGIGMKAFVPTAGETVRV